MRRVRGAGAGHQPIHPPPCRHESRLRGIEADFGPPAAAGPNTFRRDLHPDLRADYVLANPPFNPAPSGTNFVWTQRFIHHLASGEAGTPAGMAGFVLANGTISSNQSGEGETTKFKALLWRNWKYSCTLN